MGKSKCFRFCGVTVARVVEMPDGEIAIHIAPTFDMFSPKEAREFAETVLRACEYSDKIKEAAK